MAEPRWLDDEEMAAWNAFVEASNLVARKVEQQLREQVGLSHPQYEILVRLSAAPGGELRMTELAQLVVTSKSGLTYQITQLEKAGLVRRRTCESDDRGVYALLTDAGRGKLRAAAPGHVEVVRANLIDVLDRDQLRAVTAGLGAVTRHLRTSG
ncbi:DNA-binding transcriptional regulator, MarR family [Saccharopolyspora antimicrobica]|uniref:DNA-binding MarR family transcriptional regulator n=1 Tax=Saccharopolyspora antimicrobica TaxID=455193 RepID=A0A1I5I344_9PSEU|nr:MarR family transcriptional regulator [Saccharopolyspora antimicrobica]RKT83086.1 DNA-binding MarR family transcriptional regulator [Saccharopolyspora antimicrobica]SFO54536.1 DNA-binding transcriptional regulator, MarR family [Saccharopolyspora antimicrobica]